MKKYMGLIVFIFGCGFLSADTLTLLFTPPSRSYMGMISDRVNNRAIMTCGSCYKLTDGLYYNDTWEFEFATKMWQQISISGALPGERMMVASAYDSSRHSLFVFGGRGISPAFYNDVWSLDLTQGSETWTLLSTSGTPPSPRSSSSAVIDPVNDRLIIFSGEDGPTYYNDTYALNLNSLQWTQLFPSGSPPPIRFEHSAIYDPLHHRMLVFGGKNQAAFDDVWSLDLTYGSETWQQLFPQGPSPAPRGRHFCLYEPQGHNMYIGLGYDYMGYFVYYNDIWFLNLDSLIWQQTFPGSTDFIGRRGASAVISVQDNEILVFGGDQYSNAYFSETYIYTLDSTGVQERSNRTVTPNLTIYPNPSRSTFIINAFVPVSGTITMGVYDITGRCVNTLLDLDKNNHTGNYVTEWDGRYVDGSKVAAGTYYIRLGVSGNTVVEKAIVLQ